ncbi:MAG: radical SAM family heme chaperone HemW [Chloroflexi bacterium]|nr:radical SAM family heme chaperone HemW [Chloroflexota bacterium]
MDLYSIYLHVPFCRHRCSYCDFNTFAGQDRLIPAYVDAICKEICKVSAGAGERIPVHTVFFGGGTPSLLAVSYLERILDTLRERFDLLPGAEITLEANPGTVSPEYLQGLRRLGVNRLSFGMQSAHPDDLRLLERQHDFFDVAQAVKWSREAGFDNLSLDLIFALPGQPLARWQETLERAVAMQPDHLSLYSLIIEQGTPLQRRWARGLIPTVDDDLAADMYEWAMDYLPKVGFEQYEISNWARRAPGGILRACRHNLQYWYNRPYLGLGAGAHGYAAGTRTMNTGGIRPYIDRCEEAGAQQHAPHAALAFPRSPATRRAIPLSREDEMQETMMVGLRLTQEGVSCEAFQQRFGQALEDTFGPQIDRLVKLGLLEWTGAEDRRLRLTRRGIMVGNQVFMEFVGESA